MIRALLFFITFSISSVYGLDQAHLQNLIGQAQQDDSYIVPMMEEANLLLQHANRAELQEIATKIQPFARRLYFTGERIPQMERLGLHLHEVASGDHFSRIGKKYGISPEYVQLLNPEESSSSLHIGQKLKIFNNADKSVQLLVWSSRFRLLVLQRKVDGLNCLGIFPVGLGLEDRATPLGTTTVRVRQLDPVWTHPDTKEVIQPNDPDNVLGGYWIGLHPGPEGTFQSIGFHGYTGAPSEDWLSKPGSRGCVRMLQEDIHAIFALTHNGMKVTVSQ